MNDTENNRNDTSLPRDSHTETRDTSRHDEYENVANPQAPGDDRPGIEDSSVGQDGRNIRGLGSTDMDSENGVLRLNDQDNSTMEVTEQAKESIAGDQTPTASVNVAPSDVTTAGPDDYASADTVGVPHAQEEARKDNPSEWDEKTATDQDADSDEDIARTGTDTEHKPTY